MQSIIITTIGVVDHIWRIVELREIVMNVGASGIIWGSYHHVSGHKRARTYRARRAVMRQPLSKPSRRLGMRQLLPKPSPRMNHPSASSRKKAIPYRSRRLGMRQLLPKPSPRILGAIVI